LHKKTSITIFPGHLGTQTKHSGTGINAFRRGNNWEKNINQWEKTEPANAANPEPKNQHKTQTTKFSRVQQKTITNLITK
jgi:hypothetical protein